MRQYSLIKSELDYRHNKRNFKGILSSILTFASRPATYEITLRLPEHEVLRAELFIEDVAEQLDENMDLTIIDLLALLLKDFLQLAASSKIEVLKNSLIEKKREFLLKTERVEEFVEVAPGHSSLRIREKARRTRYCEVELQIPRKTALRLEVILYDLEQMYKPFQMSVEDLIMIVFMEFVNLLRVGKQKDVVKRFIQCFG
jgi:hypothetical protein